MKEVNGQSVSLAAVDICQLIMQKSHSQFDAHTAADGVREQKLGRELFYMAFVFFINNDGSG
jgi:hypothetical protein